jgi:hypothetical protein
VLAIFWGAYANRENISAVSFWSERVLILIGIILLTPVFAPEQVKNLHELIIAKSLKYKLIIYMRIILMVLILLFFILIYMFVLRNSIECIKITFLNTVVISLFLCGTGMFVTRYSKNAVTGYMASFGIYLLEMSYLLMRENYFIFPTVGIYDKKLIYIIVIILILYFFNLFNIKNLIK